MKDYPIIMVDVAKVELAPWNYKTNDEIMKLKLLNAMDKGGYIAKIVVAQREEEATNNLYEVIDGNHRVMALREKGIQQVQAIFVGRLKKTQRQRLGVELNELKFQSDNIKLAEIFGDMTKDFKIEDLVQTMPYNENEISNFAKLLDFNWGDPGAGAEGNGSEPGQEWIEFACGQIKGKIPGEVYARFVEAIEALKAQGVADLPHQIEYLCISFLNSPEAAGNGEGEGRASA